MTDTYRFDQISYYGNLDPLIKYGDSWIYGAVTPIGDVAVPTDLYVIHEKDYNIISWKNSAKEDMEAYYVYRSSTYGHADIKRIAIVTSKDSDGNTQTCYIDYLTDSEMNIQYYYTVAAVNDIGYSSAHSEWNADINQDITYGQYAYLYTDGTTQTYWNTLDLYKKLGNFDTDRNIVPFRDLGVIYGEKPDRTRYEIKKDCNYLYATLLNLTNEQKENFDRLEYKLFMDNSEISKNKPSIIESAYVYESDNFNVLDLLSVNKNIIINKFDIDFNDEFKQFVYCSSIISDNSDSGGNITNLAIDKEKFFKQYLKVTSSMHGEDEEPNPDTLLPPNTGVEFVYNNRYWQVNINGAVIELDNENGHGTLSDYGITYGTYSVINPNIKIIVNEYWQLLNDDDTYIKINTSLDLKTDVVTLKDEDLESYGITYKYGLVQNDTTINAELSRKVFTYFRVPYIYNSKLLQTYMVETGVTGKTLNKINFKAYNYLIFPSVFGKIFNQRYIKLKEMRGNLYKTDASNKAIYQNFGSYFDFVQPVWMGENAYRNCVLGTDLTAGLIDSGIDGGTFKGLNEVIYAYTQGNGVLENQDNTKYLTVYNNSTKIEQVSELPVIKYYSDLASYDLGDIVCVTDNDVEVINNFVLSVENYTPSDSNIVLIGNDLQIGNQISIEPGFTSLSGNSAAPEYILNDCEITDVYKVDTDIEADYFMYIAADSTELSSAETITISEDDPENPSNNDYYFNTIDRSMYKYTSGAWNLFTSDLLCECDNTYYYFIYDMQGLFQLVQLPDDVRYYINVNNLYKNKLYSVPNSGDSRIAIRKLVGINWVFYGYDTVEKKENYIFNNYNNWAPNTFYNVGDPIIYEDSVYMCVHAHRSNEEINGAFWFYIGLCPLSYTHNYLINTWNLIFTNWKRQITPIKYLVYGNTLKLIGDVIYDPTNFVVKDFKDNAVVYIDYTVNTKTGYLTWTNPDTKPKDGSYVLISYNVDIRKDLIKLINLIKYPQMHINYIWTLPKDMNIVTFNGLKFTAKENNSTIGYTVTGTPTGVDIKYSYDGIEWNSWESNNNIILNTNECIYVKGYNPNGLNLDTNNYIRFITTGTGKIEASGNINSLLDNDEGQTITTIPNEYCYYGLFMNCTLLTKAPVLSATILKAYCYSNMFQNCTSLTTAPELPSTELDSHCYYQMFQGCSSLVETPELPATVLADACYSTMFKDCTSLITSSELNSDNLSKYCYSRMFQGCTSLTQAPELPAMNLANYCYEYMFSGCTSLTMAPELPATTMKQYCYQYMFNGCTNLNYIKLGYTGNFYAAVNPPFYRWVYGINNTSGDFYYNGTDINNFGVSAIPTGWTVYGNYKKLKFTSKENNSTINYKINGAISSAPDMQYSTDTVTWTSWSPEDPVTLNNNEYIYVKGNNSNGLSVDNNNYIQFEMSGTISSSGNINSLLDGDNNGSTIKSIPNEYCYYGLFKGCTSLTTAPELPTTILSNHCYESLFEGCTSLTTSPKLPATVLANYCYSNMFNGCTSLTTTSVLPVSNLNDYCYYSMFKGCTSLTNTPTLPAEVLTEGCYKEMFSGCTSLTTTSSLPSKVLADYCYYGMFQDCISLSTAPYLPATTLANYCYQYMFDGCTTLNYIKLVYKGNFNSIYFTDWVKDVQSNSGDIYYFGNDLTISDSAIPVGWTLHNEFEGLKFTAKENNSTIGYTVTRTPKGSNLQYSYDGLEWNNWDKTNTITLNNNEYIYVKGNNSSGLNKDANNYIQFEMSDDGKIAASGNINSLIDDGDGSTITTIPNGYCYFKLFMNCKALTQAPELPAMNLANYCYYYMFQGCTSLVTPPELPATTMKQYCYSRMFQGCTSLTQAPELSATTLADYCCEYMFLNCTSLVTAPELSSMNLAHCCYAHMFDGCTALVNVQNQLPATTLANYCYYYMFQGCTSLVTAPELPATTLTNYCYSNMFRGCTNLNYIKIRYTGNFSSTYFTNWVNGVSSTGSFYYNGTSTSRGVSAIPNNWDIIPF